MTLTVAIPVHHYRPQLDRCLASVRGQHVIVFDSSGDRAVRLTAQELDAEYRITDSVDMIENWNAAVGGVTSGWVHMMHDDDYVRPGFYDALAPAMESDCAAFVCGYENEMNGVPNFSCRPFGSLRGPLAASTILNHLRSGNPFQPSAMVFRKEVYERVGYYRNVGALDWDFYLRAAENGGLWWHEPEYLVRREEHEASDGWKAGAAVRIEALRRTIELAEGRGLDMTAARNQFRDRAFIEGIYLGQRGMWDEAQATFAEGVKMTIREVQMPSPPPQSPVAEKM